MANTITIPLKYKFLSVMLLVVLSALSIFLYTAAQTFTEDKKLFIMDSNRTLLKAATSEIKLELKGRLEELQTFIPRVYLKGGEKNDPFQGLSPSLVDELLGVTFYQIINGTPKAVREYTNDTLIQREKLPANFIQLLNEKKPVSLTNIDSTQGVDLVNRSMRTQTPAGPVDEAVLSFVLTANFLGEASKGAFIVIDFSQTFLMRTLAQSELTEVFLLFGNGSILSHPSLGPTVLYASTPFPHPIVEKLKEKKFSRESVEVELDGEDYLCNISETGFKNVFAVSQIRKSEAFLALRTLFTKSLLIAIIVLSGATVFSVIFASGLTTNIQKLRIAAEQLGAGNLDVKLHLRSNDEIQSVARSFQWMAHQIRTLIDESLEKARLADELETARLVQETLLTKPDIESNAVEMDSHYVAATQCGGDYWDARINGNLLTVFIGDATGHGAPAAIVTAVAKSCFATLSSIHADTPLPPDVILTEMNRIIYGACRGKLLMTMCIVQLDLATGELQVANAGHESPLCLKGASAIAAAPPLPGSKKAKPQIDVIFSRGERLGFTPDATYAVEKMSIDLGDTVLLYTDGISEAKNPEGKDWGERALKKALGAGAGQALGKIKTEITQQLEKHTNGAAQEDDVTFVLFRWVQAERKSTVAVSPKIKKVSIPKSKTNDFGEQSEIREALLAGQAEHEEESREISIKPRKPKAA